MYRKLKASLVEKGISQKELAQRLKISAGQLSSKINCKYEWKKSEIDIILSVTNKKYEDIF